jgi:hypothetical protein
VSSPAGLKGKFQHEGKELHPMPVTRRSRTVMLVQVRSASWTECMAVNCGSGEQWEDRSQGFSVTIVIISVGHSSLVFHGRAKMERGRRVAMKTKKAVRRIMKELHRHIGLCFRMLKLPFPPHRRLDIRCEIAWDERESTRRYVVFFVFVKISVVAWTQPAC